MMLPLPLVRISGNSACASPMVPRMLTSREEAMNLLGYEGNFSPDYEPVFDPVKDKQKLDAVRALMVQTGELEQGA